MTTQEQFEELVATYGDPLTGLEDFNFVSEDRVQCRCGDCSMWQRSDGWHYDSEVEAYPTLLECFETRGGKPKKKHEFKHEGEKVDLSVLHKCKSCGEEFILKQRDKSRENPFNKDVEYYAPTGYNYCPYCGK